MSLSHVHPSLCAPHTIDSINAYGDESRSRPSNGDCENALPSPFVKAALISSAVNVFKVGEACDPDSLLFRVTFVVIRSKRSRADTERVIGVASSLGSTSFVKSPSTWIIFWSRPRARSLRLCSPRIPRRSAQLSDRCKAAHERVAKGVIFCRPRKASTVFVRLSIQVFRNVFERSSPAVVGLMAGRHNSDVMYEM